MMAAAMDERGGEAVALALLGLSGVRPLHFAHANSVGEQEAKGLE
jgi:hypothetical protein